MLSMVGKLVLIISNDGEHVWNTKGILTSSDDYFFFIRSLKREYCIAKKSVISIKVIDENKQHSSREEINEDD